MADTPKWEDTEEITPSWEDTEPIEQPSMETRGSPSANKGIFQSLANLIPSAPEKLPSASPLEQEALKEIEGAQFNRFIDKDIVKPEDSEKVVKATLLGGAQGTTLNNADEIEARTRSLTENRPYSEIVKEIRERNKKIIADAPIAYNLSEFGSGMLVPGLGAAKIAKGLGSLGNLIAPNAPAIVKGASSLLGTSVAATPAISAYKYGASEKEGVDALMEADPTLTELAMVPAVALGLKGVTNIPAAKDKAVAKIEDLLGDYYKSAKKLTERGVALEGRESVQNLATQAEKSASTLRKKLSDSTVSQELTEKAKAQQESDLKDLLERSKKLEESFKEEQQLTKKIQTEQNETKIKQLEVERAKLGEETEKFLDQSREKINKVYGDIDKELETANFTFNNSEGPIANFVKEVESNPNLTEEAKNQVLRALEPFRRETLDITQFRKAKDTLNKLSSNKDYEVAGLAKKTYGLINQDLVSQLDKVPNLSGISDKLKKVNDQYAAFRRYDDTFTGRGYDTKDLTDTPTLRLLKQFGGDTAEDIQKTKDVTGLLQRINPEEAPAQLSQMSQLSSEIRKAKNFSPVVPEVNPELSNLQALLNQVKSKDPTVAPTQTEVASKGIFNVVGGAPLEKTKSMTPLELQDVDRNLAGNLFKKFVEDPAASLSTLGKQGFQANALAEMRDTIKKTKDLDVAQMVNAGLFSKTREVPVFTSDPAFATQQAAKAVTRKYGGFEGTAANIGVLAGNMSKNPKSLYNYYNKVSAPLGNILRKIANDPDESKRVALTFATLQNPAYRQELKNAGALNDTEDTGNEEAGR